MCMRTHMKDKVGFMTDKTFYKAFEGGVPYAVKLNWRGESLLHSRIAEYVAIAKRLGVIDVALNTNGILLTPDMAYRLAQAGLDRLIISVDGATKLTYETIREGADFAVLYKNIIGMNGVYADLDKRPQVTIQMCQQELNQHEVALWHHTFGIYADRLRIGKLFDPQGKYGYKKAIPRSCGQPWQRITVDWKGNIYPCPSDYLGKVYLGNVHDTTIKSAWHSERMNKIRKTLTKHGRKSHLLCENCSAYC